MGEAIGPMLASAVAVALSPLPLIAVLLILASPHGRANGIAFTAGWLLGLAAVVASVVAAGTALDPARTTPTWSSWLKLGLGTALLLLAARQWRERPRPGRVTAPPAWLLSIDRLTAARSAGLAVVLIVAHPKTLIPAVGGAASIAAAPTGTGVGVGVGITTGIGIGIGGKAVAATLMVLLGSLGTLLPLVVHLVGNDHARHTLGEWRAWTATHNAAIMTAVPLLLGAEYLGAAVSGLA
ncbi:GAP family protein [Kitasatospora sp. NPDC048298]|uniref:GAP family protein n=1 Tax=Kitasatospora sp. NPDC048298 TaxID=3364049 RepID=UPI003720FC89